MTTTTAWAHLPNARHIDAVLADVKARPWAWDAAAEGVWSNQWDGAGVAAWKMAQDTTCTAMWDAAQDAVFTASITAAGGAAWGATSALIAWDSSADLLDLSPDALRTLMDVATAPVCHQAALLLPWAIVKHTTEESNQ